MTRGRIRQAAVLVALAAFVAGAAAQQQQQQKDAFKGKVKEGEYEMKLEMEIAGSPKQSETKKQCVSASDLDKGLEIEKGCQIRDFKSSASTVSFSTVCAADEMTADNVMTFTPGGYKAETKTTMKQGGKMMKSTMRVDSRYLGPCKKK